MSQTRYILAGKFIDGSGAAVRRHVFLAVTDGIITAIGPAAEMESRQGAMVDDLSHCTVVPALVDCSVSLSRSASVDWQVRLAAEEAGPAAKRAMLEKHVRYCHAHGVLGVADSDDASGLVADYLQRSGQGNIIHIRTSGRLCRTRHDCAAGSRAGADFIKVDYSGNIEDRELTSSLLAVEDLRRIIQNRDGRKVVVVANGPEQVREALQAGCDAIEQGYGMGAENLARMAELGVLWIPCVGRAKNGLHGAAGGGSVCCRFSGRYVAPGKPDPGAEVFWKKMLADQLAQLRLARELGVNAAVGTGAGSPGLLHGESMVEEMKLFMKAGYSLAETIRCASEVGASFFGMQQLGALLVGRQATFLLSRGTVQQLPRKLSYLEHIYIAGRPSAIYSKNPIITG